jgi:ssDNA-binding Zn-finger/Zn-ribbon topoisomerase 1
MARWVLTAGAEMTRCPSCGGPMSSPIQGRRTRRWLRHCVDAAACGDTTITDEAPTPMLRPRPAHVYRAAGLPLAPLEALATTIGARLREPGEEG